MNSTQSTPEYPEIDYCILSFSILGIIGTIFAILQLTLAYIRKTCLCIPKNTWHLHFLLLIGILSLFVSACIPEIFVNYIVFCFTQLSPAICLGCILTLATNLLFVCIYQQYFLSTSLIILPVLLAFPIGIPLILVYKSQYMSGPQYTTNVYPYMNAQGCINYTYMELALTNVYLYLDYFLTISMVLTLCLYKTFYGKLLCLTTWTSWILWNINWSIFCSCIHLFATLYFYPTFGYILLLFYIYPILLSKYITAYNKSIYALVLSPPPRYSHSRLKNKHEYITYWLYKAFY
nr:G protein-coupled receptor 8C [Elephant endotheliotropic herpesvirus 1A]